MFPKANKNAYTQEPEYARFQKQTLIIRQIWVLDWNWKLSTYFLFDLNLSLFWYGRWFTWLCFIRKNLPCYYTNFRSKNSLLMFALVIYSRHILFADCLIFFVSIYFLFFFRCSSPLAILWTAWHLGTVPRGL